jgi:hypothetical protein
MPENREYQRVQKIRNARNQMADLVKQADADAQHTDGVFEGCLVSTDFLKAIVIWLDKALQAASRDSYTLPGGEVDHAIRVAEGWFGDELGSFYRGDNSVGSNRGVVAKPKNQLKRKALCGEIRERQYERDLRVVEEFDAHKPVRHEVTSVLPGTRTVKYIDGARMGKEWKGGPYIMKDVSRDGLVIECSCGEEGFVFERSDVDSVFRAHLKRVQEC